MGWVKILSMVHAASIFFKFVLCRFVFYFSSKCLRSCVAGRVQVASRQQHYQCCLIKNFCCLLSRVKEEWIGGRAMNTSLCCHHETLCSSMVWGCFICLEDIGLVLLSRWEVDGDSSSFILVLSPISTHPGCDCPVGYDGEKCEYLKDRYLVVPLTTKLKGAVTRSFMEQWFLYFVCPCLAFAWHSDSYSVGTDAWKEQHPTNTHSNSFFSSFPLSLLPSSMDRRSKSNPMHGEQNLWWQPMWWLAATGLNHKSYILLSGDIESQALPHTWLVTLECW